MNASSPKLALILVSVSTPEQAADKKQSLETQERDLRAIAAQNGWKVIDVLKIPGFSRDYISWEDCAADMRKAGITAMDDLKRYCNEGAFDVFMVRDADRFGRTQSLVMQIAETIGVRLGKEIYSQIDGLIKPEGCRMWAMMAGWRSAGEMDKKKMYHRNGMEKRAANGFHEARTPWYHRTVHDTETGKPLRVEVQEEYRYIWDAVFEIVVNARTSFSSIEHKLYVDYQIVNPRTGKRFTSGTFYTLLSSPALWGHRIRGRREYTRREHQRPPPGDWIFDASHPPPEGIKMFYDVLPPVYTGQQADEMKAELHRRFTIRGGRKPANTMAFSGLVVCDSCHYQMSHIYVPSRDWRGCRCMTNYRPFCYQRPPCHATSRSVTYQEVKDWTNAFLMELLDGYPLDEAFPFEGADALKDLESVRQQIKATQQEAERLVARLGLVPESMLPQLQKQIESVDKRLTALRDRERALLPRQPISNRDTQQLTLKEIETIGLQAFWKLPEGRQNQLLLRLFGNWRLVAFEGKIIGVKNNIHLPKARQMKN